MRHLILLVLVGCTTGVEPTPSQLAGAWGSDCIDNGAGQGITLAFDLTESRWDLDYTVHGDAACEAPFMRMHIAGPYGLGDASSVPGAREGNFHFEERTITPFGDAAAAFVSETCGSEFPADVATSIVGGCAGLGAYPHEVCPTDHDIVAIEGDTLRFGARPADNDMCAPEKRPTALGAPLSRR